MYIQNLSEDILNISEKEIIKNSDKLDVTINSAKWLIFIKKLLVSNSIEATSLQIRNMSEPDCVYQNLYLKFISLIENNEKLEQAVTILIQQNLGNITVASGDFKLTDKVKDFEKNIMENIDIAIENVISFLNVLGHVYSDPDKMRLYLINIGINQNVIDKIENSNIKNLFSSYINEINSSKNTIKVDKQIKLTQDLNKQLMKEVTDLQSKLQTSMMKDHYKNVLLDNMSDQISIMHMEEMESNLEDELSEMKIVNSNLKDKIESLKSEIENKISKIDSLNNEISLQSEEINKFKMLSIFLFIYSLIITIMLIINIQNMKYNRRLILERCYDINRQNL